MKISLIIPERRKQLSGRDACGAELADDNAAGVVGHIRSHFWLHAARECQREHRNRGIPGTTDIINFTRPGGDVVRGLLALEKPGANQ